MSTFKAGDLVYCPRISAKIFKLESLANEDRTYILSIPYSDKDVYASFTRDGKIRDDFKTQDIFHVNRENYDLLTKLYDIELAHPSTYSIRAVEVVRKLLDNGWSSVCCITPTSSILAVEAGQDVVKDSNGLGYSHIIPYDPESGKAILNYVDGKIVLDPDNLPVYL